MCFVCFELCCVLWLRWWGEEKMPLGQVCREAQKEPEGTARSWHWLSCESLDLNFDSNIFNTGHKCALWVKWHWIVVISLSLRWRCGAYTCTRIFFLRCNCLRPMCFRRRIYWETFFGLHIILIHSLMKVYLSHPKNFEIWGEIYETFDTQSRNTSDLLCFDEGSQREGMLHFKRSQTYIILCYLFIRNSQEEADKVAGKVADEVARNPEWQNSTRVAEILQFKNRRVSCTCVVAPTNAFFAN